MSIAELENVFELLEGSCEKLHYLVRRSQFEVNAEYLADEMDLLAFYVDTAFNIGEEEFDRTGLFLYGVSKSLDPYFMSQSSGQRVTKPRRRLTRFWKNMLRWIEQRRFPRWTELGIILLNVDYDRQLEFEKGFKAIRRSVQQQWQTPSHNNVYLMLSGPLKRQEALIGFAYKRIKKDERDQMMSNAGHEALKRSGTQRVLIIGVDLDDREHPYSVAACYSKRTPGVSPATEAEREESKIETSVSE
jgi:hypothetical protein